jgi:MFS family permease
MRDPAPPPGEGPGEDAAAAARARRKVLRTVLVGVAASTFPITVLSTAIPTIAADFDSELSVLTWVITAPLIALAVITPIAGKLGDLHGHRRLYLGGFVATGVLSMLTAAAWSAPALVVLRTVSQSAAAATGPASMALIVHTFPREERTRALGAWASVTAISPTIGVLVGGPLTDVIGWRMIFLTQGALALVAVAVSRRALPETPRRTHVHFDLAGGLTLGLGVGATLFAVNRAATWGFDHPTVGASLAVGLAGFAAFVRAERRAEEPIIPVDLLRSRTFTSPLLAQFVLNGSYMGTLLVTPVFLERLMGYGATARGLVTIPRPLGFAIGAGLGGRAEPRHGARVVVIAGTAVVALAMVLQGLAAQWQSIVLVLVALFLAGLGNGYCRPAIASAVANAADEGDAGVAAASLNTVSQIGAAAGNTVYTAMAGESTDPTRFLLVFLVAAATGVVAIAMAFRLQDEPITAARP